MNSIPLHISLLFIALVFTIAFFIVISVHASGRKAGLDPKEQIRNFIYATLCIVAWLTYTLLILGTGLLDDFNSFPPRILLITVPILILIGLLFLSPHFLQLIDHLDGFWLVYPQCFRIIMELILWSLYHYRVIPVQMTFEGRNFDILAGISAPFIAYYYYRRKTLSPNVALLWNIIGLILLINIVAVAMLSTPYPFRMFMNEPANTIIFHFPFLWLPSFVVPFALLLHLLSIRKILQKRKVAEALLVNTASAAAV